MASLQLQMIGASLRIFEKKSEEMKIYAEDIAQGIVHQKGAL